MLFELKSVFQNDGARSQVDYQLDMSQIDIDGVFPFKSPVLVSAAAFNRTGLITLELSCSFDYERSCDRCCESFKRNMRYSFVHKLAQTLEDDGNDEYIETPDFTLELDDIVLSDILLSLPQKNLCKEDCRGLCPQCGKNLNEGPCGCDNRQIHPGLEVLKQFMK